jgi:glutathione S-transferase
MNAKGAVPALRLDNNEILTENSAIQQYLVDTQKAIHLLPAVGDLKRYRVLEWLGYVNSDLHKGFGPLFNPKVPQDLKDDIFIPNIKAKLDYLDKHFSQSPYLLDHYTLPDGYLFVILRWAPNVKIDLSPWKNVSRYYNELKARPSIQVALGEEGIH